MPRTSAAPNREILEAALQGLEAQKQRLDEQIAQVRALIGHRVGRPPKASASKESGASSSQSQNRKRRTLSAEARKRIAAAQKKRWAAFRKTQG